MPKRTAFSSFTRALVGVSILGLLLGILPIATARAGSDFPEAFVQLMNVMYGSVCQAELKGWTNSTLKIDWTASTRKIDAVRVLAEVGSNKRQLYEGGVRYFQFPNSSGGYNVIDWKTGEKNSMDDRAPYYMN